MYYMIVSGGQIVDVCDGLRFVKWQEKNHLFLCCEEADADGVVSSDDNNVYLLDGRPQVRDCAYATYTEITKEQYDELRAELIDGGTIEDDTDEGREQEPVKRAEWLERLETLENMNAMLTECILEMSEIIYGE